MASHISLTLRGHAEPASLLHFSLHDKSRNHENRPILHLIEMRRRLRYYRMTGVCITENLNLAEKR